ncbi:MAG: transcriptional regulatory protein RprY [Melioribacteraceae bacterium]|nr:MAG: transcriptional regulatory protein RprY [Melioribacteraceae bacterium]
MSENNKILLVEDDVNLGTILKEFLEIKGFTVKLAFDGDAGSQYFKGEKFTLIILDIMMPKKDGFTLAKEIRASNKSIPIIFLTARSMQHDVIEGFKLGADDYITKPFSTEELFLRLNAIMKRTYSSGLRGESEEYEIGKFIFKYDESLLLKGKNEQKLTSKENELLHMLCMNINSTMERKEALEKIWGEDNYFNARSMDVYITKLRGYLKSDPAIEIKNIHGTGYRLNCKPV